MKKPLFIALIACAFAGGTAGAHEFFVKPDSVRIYKNGDTVNLDLYSTHRFMEGEELEPPETNDVYVLQGTRNTPLNLSANQRRLIYQMRYRLNGNLPVLVVGHRKPVFLSRTTDGVKVGAKHVLQAQGLTVIATTMEEKWCKTFINPSPNDADFSKSLGMKLEIIPVTNPANFRKNQPAVFQVWYNGKPLSDGDFSAACDNKTIDYVFETKTDVNGYARITPNTDGIWFVRTAVDIPVTGQADYDRESLSAIAVFTVNR